MTEQPTPRASIDDLLSGPDATDSGMAGHDPAPAPGGGLDPGATPGEPGDGPAGPGTDFEIMPRPRRRPTRLTAALALLAATAAGFAGGLHAPGRPANTGAPSQAGGPALGSGQAATGNLSPAGAGLPGGNPPGMGGGITGTLKAVRGSVIYVTDIHGKTVTALPGRTGHDPGNQDRRRQLPSRIHHRRQARHRQVPGTSRPPVTQRDMSEHRGDTRPARR